MGRYSSYLSRSWRGKGRTSQQWRTGEDVGPHHLDWPPDGEGGGISPLAIALEWNKDHIPIVQMLVLRGAQRVSRDLYAATRELLGMCDPETT